jgi:VWFA-related protein
VNVLCNVYDKRGALVNDLKQDDFEVREDGKLQQIRFFARESNLSLMLALLVDVSGSVKRFVEAERDTAVKFVRGILRPDDSALLVGFGSTLVLWQDFTSSAATLEMALGRLRAVPFHGLPAEGQSMPGTLLYDAIYRTVSDKLTAVAGRKVIVIISDGLDNGSVTKLEEAVALAQSTNVMIYGICYEGPFPGCSYLKSLAEPTGGRQFKITPKTSLQDIFQTIEDEVRGQYALGYVPANRSRDGKFRKLEVRVHKPGLQARARKGYFAAGEPR